MKSLHIAININDLKMFVPLLREMSGCDNTIAVRAHRYKNWYTPSDLQDIYQLPNCQIVFIQNEKSFQSLLSKKFDVSFMNAGQFYKLLDWYQLTDKHVSNMGKKIGISWFLDLFAKSAIGKLNILDHVVVQSKSALETYKMFPVYAERPQFVEKCLHKIRQKMFWNSPYFDFKHYCRSPDKVRSDWNVSSNRVALLVHSVFRGNDLSGTQKCYNVLSDTLRGLGYKVLVKLKNNAMPICPHKDDVLIKESSINDLFSFAEACSISDVMVMMRETMSLFEAGMYGLPILIPEKHVRRSTFKHFWGIIDTYPWAYMEFGTNEMIQKLRDMDKSKWVDKWVTTTDTTNAEYLLKELVYV